MIAAVPLMEDFVEQARAWLGAQLPLRTAEVDRSWGTGSFDVSVFRHLDEDAERTLLARECAWQRRKIEAGYGAIGWPVEHGGRGFDQRYATAFAAVEGDFDAPLGHELVMVTTKLIAPTLLRFGREAQKQQHLPSFLRADELCCQLFSEPGAGSDLASLATRARQVDGRWQLSGQKIWSSGAQFAQWGLLLARTDPEVPKHAGITAFLVPLDTAGVEVRPIRQMAGGASFCEVHLDNVVLDDDLRVGEVGQGWAVAIATLGFEREVSDGSAGVGGSWEQVRQLAEHLNATADPRTRQQLARVYTRHTLNQLSAASDAARRAAGEDLDATGSLRKLQWVGLLREISDTVSPLLAERLVADTGEWGTFGWSDHVLGSLGYSIAGGSDEIQRNLLSERLLGLPGDVRADKGVPWSQVPR